MSLSIYQRSSGKWKADIQIEGVRRSKTFERKKEAQAWAIFMQRELILNNKTQLAIAKHNIVITVAEALRRYASEVSTFKKTAKKEKQRILYFIAHLPQVDFPLVNYKHEFLAQWQSDVMNRSVRPLSAGSVLRDYSLLSAFFNWCRLDKGWIDFNPVENVRKPKKPEHRVRRISEDEIHKMLNALGYVPSITPKTKMQQVGLIWLIAMATGMRSGEIIGCKTSDVLLNHDCIILPDTKNGSKRVVPLDGNAKTLWKIALDIHRVNSTQVFSITDKSRDTLFRKARAAANLQNADLTFHDSRHEAASQMAKRVKNALTLCKIFGWKDPKFALVYYNPTNDEIVRELNQSTIDSQYKNRVNKVTPSDFLS